MDIDMGEEFGCEIDHNISGEMVNLIEERIESGDEDLVLDFRKVSFIPSSILNSIISFSSRIVKSRGKELILRNLSSAIEEQVHSFVCCSSLDFKIDQNMKKRR